MKNRFKLYLSLACMYAVLIFYLSSRSDIGDPKFIFDFLDIEKLRRIFESLEHSYIRVFLSPLYIFTEYPDKLFHIVLYAGFGFFLHFTFRNSSSPALRKHAIVFAIIIGTLYGASDEFHQSFVPGRSASTGDLIADGIGVLLAQVILYIRYKLCSIYRKDHVIRNLSPRRFIHNLKNTTIPYDDLKLSVILIILSLILILKYPDNLQFLRILFMIPFLLFLPGYLLILMIFPKRDELGPMERFTLSIGFSIAIAVFDGFALNYTPWGYRPDSIVISLSMIMGLLLAVVFFERVILDETAYGFSLGAIMSFYRALRKKDPGDTPDPALEKILVSTMILSIILVSALLAYAYVSREPENFTAFYILGEEGKAEKYPDSVMIGQPVTILVGVENYEYQPVNYTMKVQLDGKILEEKKIYLEHEAKWLENVTFVPELTSSIVFSGTNDKGDDRYKLEFVLFKDNIRYRSVHLWVKTVFDARKYTPVFNVKNGDMEQTSEWNFKSNDENITGSYINTSWVSPLHSYRIDFNTGGAGEWGEIYQNLTVNQETIGSISFLVRDSAVNATTNISKQVLLNNRVIWEEGAGNSSWVKKEIPAFFSQNTRLAFRVFNNRSVNGTVQVWWDDIKIEPYVNQSIISDRTITRQVLLNEDYSQLEFNIHGSPIKMKKDSKVRIDGSNFPLFYYDIDENRSYETLDLVFSGRNLVEAGNATYVAKVHDNEISLFGSTYKVINENDAGTLLKIFFKNAENTLNLSEKWAFENGYTFHLTLINSERDKAMLELRKGSWQIISGLIWRGNTFEYTKNFDGITVPVFRSKVKSITLNSVKLEETDLYSDEITHLKVGDTIGDFEITNVSSTTIEMKNTYPLEINDGALILGSNIRFRVIDDMAFPYASSGEIHGSLHTIRHGDTVNINGMNFPGFHYDFANNISLEELSMRVSYNETVDVGKAVYKARRNGDEIYFLGDSYWLPRYQRVNLLSGFSRINRTLPRNGSLSLENGLILTFEELSDDRFEVIVRKNMTEYQKNLMNMSNGSKTVFFKDYYYEIFVNTYEGRFKSNIMEEGDEFEYWIEYAEDRKHKLISGRIRSMDSRNMTVEVNQFKIPEEILPGMTFGKFEVESIIDDTITLRNTKPIKFEPGKETPLLGGFIRIRTSAEEPVIRPVGSN